MDKIWDAIQHVTTGLSLAAFVAAAIVFVLRAQINRDRKLIQTAPEQERTPLVDRVLGGIDTRGFTSDHKYRVALEQLRDRSRRFLISAVVIVLLALIAATISIVALIINSGRQVSISEPKVTTTLTSARLIWPKAGVSDPSQYGAAGLPTITDNQINDIQAVVEDQTVANGLKPFFLAGSVDSPITCDLTFPIWDDSGGFADKESIKVAGTMDRDHTDEVRASIASLKFPTPQRPAITPTHPGIITPEEIQNAPTHLSYFEVRMEIKVTLPSD